LVALLFVIGVGVAGTRFFPADTKALWMGPWLGLIVLLAGSLLLLPLVTILEGCGQVLELTRYRFYQSVVSSLLLWSAAYGQAGLWIVLIAAASALARDVYVVFWRYRGFFRALWSSPHTEEFSWKMEVWPMQWRLAFQAAAGYFVVPVINPIVFHYQGAVEAGRIGMSLQATSAIQSLGQAWLLTQLPAFGRTIAVGDFDGLHRHWKRAGASSIAVVTIVGALAVGILALGRGLGVAEVERLVAPWQLGVLVLVVVLSQIVQIEAAYLRAFKVEPFLWVGVAGGIISGASVWFFGMWMGLAGVVIGYWLGTLVIAAWASAIFWRRRHPSLFARRSRDAMPA